MSPTSVVSEETTTLDDIFAVLLDVLDELREHNGKARISPDVYCPQCGRAYNDPTHDHPGPRALS